MAEDYPQLDNAMMSAMVDDYETKENKPSIENDGDLPPVPLPPEAVHDTPLPSFDAPVQLPFSAPIEDSFVSGKAPHKKKTIEPLLPVEVQQPKQELNVETSDVQELALLENVFDKRITEQDVQREMAVETRNDSGRLLDKEDIEVKTELNDKEILTMSKLLLISDRYDVPVLRDFTDNLMLLKISRGRKGRTEFIQGLHADERREQPPEGFFSKIFGGQGR